MTDQTEVLLSIYDISKGLAPIFGPFLLGKEVPGIWHTGVIVFNKEYYFTNGCGIVSSNPGQTSFGKPDQIIQLGRTEIPYSLFSNYLFTLGETTFSPTSYNLLTNNCNNFSNEISVFLTGNGIPKEILNLPIELLSSAFRQYLIPSFQQPTEIAAASPNPLNNLSANQPQPTTRFVDQIQNRLSDNSSTMADGQQEEDNAMINDTNEDCNDKDLSNLVSSRRSYKYDDPPIVFKDVDGIAALKKVEEMVVNLLNPQQQQLLKEIDEYLHSDSGAWAIGDEHLDLIAFLLNGGNGKFAPNVILLTLEVLQAASLKDDVVLILHQDRKDHRIMSYINRIENLTLAEQEEIVKLLCNLCGQPATIDWLLYISEWCENGGQPNNNSRVTVRAAVHTLLNDQLTTLQRNGVYLIYNLSLKEVFEDVSIELATALLQYMHSELPDDQAFLCLTAIIRFIEISPTDVPALIKMLGPDLNKYKGKNNKMDKFINEIEDKVAKLPSFS